MAQRFEQGYAFNNGMRKCPGKIIITMSLPCSKDLLANCTSQLRSESFDGESTIAEDDSDDLEGDDDDDDKKPTFEAETTDTTKARNQNTVISTNTRRIATKSN